MLDPRLLKRGWSTQKWFETNRILENSYVEFNAHLRRKPVWRAFAPFNSLSDWDAEPSATLDASQFISSPSSALQNANNVTLNPPYPANVEANVMTLRALTVISQAKVTCWFRFASTQYGCFFLLRNLIGLGNARGTTYYACFLNSSPDFATQTSLEASNNGVIGFNVGSGTPLGNVVNTWMQFQVLYWVDATLGFIVRTSQLSPTPTTAPDMIDSGNAFASNIRQRISIGQMNSASVNNWYDDFQLFTP